MTITATELKNNLGKYIELAETEDIYITKNGKKKIKIISAKESKMKALKNMLKDYYDPSIDDGMDMRDLKWDRLKNV